ncbi:MAG TPA: Zn-dependent hydrolase [Candidatus Limnocylindrales bacterium]|nr:Zn-dependent hydrolase [Candidatus Limnocylindrales bacterium]
MTDIDAARFLEDMRAFSRIGGRPDGGLDRLAWSPADVEGRRWLAARLRESGLEARTDEALNVFGHHPDSSGPFLLVGSHADSVPRGGRLDGAYGVIAALEVLRSLHESHDPLALRVETVAFADEEGVRFGEGLLGSKALAGDLDISRLRAARDREGVPAPEVLRRAGVDLDRMPEAAGHRDQVAAYLELHIEQGPRMAAAGSRLAVVTGIVGVHRQQVRIAGEQNHAGTTPFRLRRDAGRAAARAIAGLRELVQEIDAEAVANVGVIGFEPGAINVVPGRAAFDLEVRHLDEGVIDHILDAFADRLRAVCEQEGCTAETALRSRIPPARMDAALMRAFEQACRSLDEPVVHLASGAGHDAQVMARHVPSAMLFVPSHRGISHAPEEDTPDEDLVRGVRALLQGVRAALTGR